MERSQCDGANRWNDELETARSGSAQCIPLLRVPLRSQQPPSSSSLPSTLTRLRAPYLVHGNSARVHGSLAMARRRSWRKKEEEKSVETKKKDQRRTDRARINCHNTGSSLSTNATYVFSSLGKCVECYNESSLFWTDSLRFVCSFYWRVLIGDVVLPAEQDITKRDIFAYR